MDRSAQRNLFCIFLILSIVTLAKCGLLEMSQILWTKAVSGGLTKIGKLDPLRIPVIKVDQSEGDTSYRMILKNLEIVGLNESTLESIHIARGKLKSNLSELESGYMSYSDLRDIDSIRYRFHTRTKEPSVQKESFEATVADQADIRPDSRYQEDYFGRLQQDQYRARMFEQNRQYDQQVPVRPYPVSDGFYRGNLRVPNAFERNPENVETIKRRPADVQSVYAQRVGNIERYQANTQRGMDVIDCIDTRGFQFSGNQRGNQQYGQRQNVDGRHYEKRIEDIEVSASQTVESRLKNQDNARIPASHYKEQSLRLDSAILGNSRLSKDRIKEQSGYIDIIYADDKANGSMKRFGNFAFNSRENQQVYDIKDIMKDIQDTTKFIIYNFTEGEALTKRNDLLKSALETKKLKDLARYAKDYQEQQGYFEEGMQLIYHFGALDKKNDSTPNNINFTDTKRTKRAHPEEGTEDDVMHVILRISVPLLRVKSQYTLMGKVGKEPLRGNGLFTGNFTDLVGDFTLELKKVNEELITVRAAKAKLSTKDKRINLQGMNEKGPVQIILNHGLMAAEAVAAMLADDFATKGLSEKTADAVIYKMYKDLPVN